MVKFRLLEESNTDQLGLNSVMQSIGNPPFSPKTQSPTLSKKRGSKNNFIAKCGQTLVILSLGAMVKNGNIILPILDFQEQGLTHYNDTVNKPYNDYINQLNSLSPAIATITKDDILKKIIAFKSLRENWDGYGAFPLEVESAHNAIRFVNLLTDRIVEKISDICPTTNGTVSIVCENSEGERLALELGNSTLSYYIKLNSQEPEFFNNVNINAKEINKISDTIKTL